MKKKNNEKKNKANSTSTIKNALNTVNTCSSDRSLFKSLGLNPFVDIPINKEYFIGEVKYKNGSVIKISVRPMPALFWKFEIFVSGNKKTTKFSTGYGALNNFWNAIKLKVEDILDLEIIKLKK